MAERNSYTFAIIVIIGLAVLFFIYWFTTSRNKNPMNLLKRENFANSADEDEDAMMQTPEMNESFSNMDNVNGTIRATPQEDLYRMAHAQNFPPESKKPMNGDLVGQGMQAEYSQNPAVQQLRQAACFPKEMLSPEELKPQDNSSLWAQVNPQGEGSLKGRSFLQAGHHIGINTVGQTMRNANLQLRSEPPNPQVLVSPWNQTTIEPDVNRKPLEIGGCS